jgi:S1-C subfamily serine protease
MVVPIPESRIVPVIASTLPAAGRRAGAGLAIVASPPAGSALPATVDGQPLPTLAPMLERATPAVVNIATESRVALRRNPLLDDPFFRHFFQHPRSTA